MENGEIILFYRKQVAGRERALEKFAVTSTVATRPPPRTYPLPTPYSVLFIVFPSEHFHTIK